MNTIRYVTIGSRMVVRRLVSSNTFVARFLRCGLLVAFVLFLSWSTALRGSNRLCLRDATSSESKFRISGRSDVLVNGVSARGDFRQISDEDIYVYSAFYDDRYRTKYIRIFGMQNSNQQYTIRCRLKFDNRVRVDLPTETNYAVFKKWPSDKLLYHAYYHGCQVPQVFDFSKNFSMSLLVEGSDVETDVPLHMAETHVARDGNADQSHDVIICVKAMWGHVNATRLIEWVEFNRMLGVNKIVIYDTTIFGPATRILEYYHRIGFVDVIKFDYTLKMYRLMQNDPFRSQLSDDGLLLEQTYLVSMNDCYYRYKNQADYILVIDQDEVIVPNKDMSMVEMVNAAEAEGLNASAFLFHTAWHLEEFGVGDTDAPSYMHMQRYTKRTPVMQSQPKALISNSGAIVINWHGTITMPDGHGLTGNQYLPWQRFGYVHHFRNKCKYEEPKCAVLAQMTEYDETIVKYKDHVQSAILQVLKHFHMDNLLH